MTVNVRRHPVNTAKGGAFLKAEFAKHRIKAAFEVSPSLSALLGLAASAAASAIGHGRCEP
jgi:hypothetical protein